MVSKFALLSNLLLVSAALAVPSSSPVGAALSPSHETRTGGSTPNATSNQYYAGVSTQTPGYFETITAVIDVPNLSGADGRVNAWVGIDADRNHPCDSEASFRAGVECSISGGTVTYRAWFQWSYAYDYVFTNIAIHENDTITVTLMVDSPVTGVVYMQNQDTGDTAWDVIRAPASRALCQHTVSWMVSSDSIDKTDKPLAEFDGVLFGSTTASDPTGAIYPPDGGNALYQIAASNGSILTTLDTYGNAILVQHN